MMFGQKWIKKYSKTPVVDREPIAKVISMFELAKKTCWKAPIYCASKKKYGGTRGADRGW